MRVFRCTHNCELEEACDRPEVADTQSQLGSFFGLHGTGGRIGAPGVLMGSGTGAIRVDAVRFPQLGSFFGLHGTGRSWDVS